MAHIIIDKLIIYPSDGDTPYQPGHRTLYTYADGLPIPINIPDHVPITGRAIKDYLLSILPTYAEIYHRKLAEQPTHNYDIHQEFDIDL